jgi:hypothetical protein
MLCDIGCGHPLGNLIPSSVHVTEDPLAAQTSRHVQETNERLDLALARLHFDLRATRREFRAVAASAAETREDVVRLKERPAVRNVPPPVPWVAYAGWFLAGTTTALLVGRRRTELPFPPRDLTTEDIPDNAPSLTRTP